MDSVVNYIFNLMSIERNLNRFGILIILIFYLRTTLGRRGRRGLKDNSPREARLFGSLVTKKTKRKGKEKKAERTKETRGEN
jgi:hypothetical protein